MEECYCCKSVTIYVLHITAVDGTTATKYICNNPKCLKAVVYIIDADPSLTINGKSSAVDMSPWSEDARRNWFLLPTTRANILL